MKFGGRDLFQVTFWPSQVQCRGDVVRQLWGLGMGAEKIFKQFEVCSAFHLLSRWFLARFIPRP
jgi:hypothetical protein